MADRYAEVIVDIAHQNVDRVYTYILPDHLYVQKGHRVRVPFGGRTVEGYVLGLTDSCDLPVSKLKTVLGVQEEEPLMLPHMVDLALWLRQHSYSLLVDALRLLIPPTLRGGPARIKTRRMADTQLRGEEFEVALAALKRAPKQQELLRLLLEKGPLPTQELPQGSDAALRALAEKGFAVIDRETVRRTPHKGLQPERDVPFAPTFEQERALTELYAAFSKRKGAFLLHGVTGSGKTEVYLQLIQRALDEGRQAILLVPEIALTPQMVSWFRARFPDKAAVLHSRLSQGERLDEWLRIRNGEAMLAVGARSALFAPFSNLGVIVVDEEHEGSYHSDHAPRYDAREVALERGRREGAVVVLGSATPSLETYRMAQSGKLTLLELTRRVENRPMPQVQIVDMREEIVKGNRSIFSGLLQGELKATTQAGRQVMLLMNRRGYSPFVTCRMCGKTIKCDQCDVSMVHHQTDNRLHCHYCDATAPLPELCPVESCRSPYIKFFGAGTQKVEQELKLLLPNVSVLRMDIDTTAGKDGHEKILRQFREGKAQVLIGTQMIAKGHDFPRVTLVGILAADLSLRVPDYRSEERTFQLLTQMAGRAGRGRDPGLVIVQSYDPEHYAVQTASRQDYREFYTAEIRRRGARLYPPFTIVARLLCVSENPDAAKFAAETLWDEMSQYLDLNPMMRRHLVQIRALPAPLSKLKGETRYMLFLKLYNNPQVQPALAELLRLSQLKRDKTRVYLEINPSNLM